MEGFIFPCLDNAIFPFLGWLGEEGKEESKFDPVTAHVLPMPRWCETYWDSQFSFLHLYESPQTRKCVLYPVHWQGVPEHCILTCSCPAFCEAAIFSRIAALLQLLFLQWFLLNFVVTERSLSRTSLQPNACWKGNREENEKNERKRIKQTPTPYLVLLLVCWDCHGHQIKAM